MSYGMDAESLYYRDQYIKKMEAENEALRKSVEELRARYKVTPEMLDKAYTPDYWHFAGSSL